MLQHNIRAGTHHHGATCASARLLHVAGQRRASPRDCPASLVEFSSPRTRAVLLTATIARPKKRGACKPVRTIPPSGTALSADKECLAAWLPKAATCPPEPWRRRVPPPAEQQYSAPLHYLGQLLPSVRCEVSHIAPSPDQNTKM